MNWRNFLLVLLVYSFVFEVLFAGVIFIAPERAMELAKISVNRETLFLAFGLGTCLAGIALVCGLALKQVAAKNPNGHVLVDVLGYWWVAVGVAIFLKWGIVDNLFYDSLKGALLVLGNNRVRRLHR